MGHESEPRWLELERSETKIRNSQRGFELLPPPLASDRITFDQLVAARDDLVSDEGQFRIVVDQTELPDGRILDTEDRVTRGAAVVRALVDAGL
jgi:hypothetical protein